MNGNRQAEIKKPAGGILFVVPWDLHHVGGVNQVVINLGLSFRDTNLGTPLLMNSMYDSAGTRRERLENGLPLIRFTLRNPRSAQNPVRSIVSFLIRLPFESYRLYRLLNAEHISTINFHYPSLSSISGVLVAKLLEPTRRVLLSFHGADIKAAREARGFWKAVWRGMLHRVDAVVFCSKSLAMEFEAMFPELRSKCHVVHNGVEIARLESSADRGTVPLVLARRRYLLNAATLEWKKGQDTLIKAFSRIAFQYPDIDLVIMGRPAEAKPELVKLVDELSLTDRVLIFDDVSHDDLLATMKRAEVFVLPSRKEPFGIVLLEAAAFRVPVVASRTGGIVEIVENGVTGVLVEPENVDALADGIATILDGRIQGDALAGRFHELVSSTFTWKKAAAIYAQLSA